MKKKTFIKPQVGTLQMDGVTILAGSDPSKASNPPVGGGGTSTGEQNAKEIGMFSWIY